MKTKIFAAFAGIALLTAGCISTVSGTRTPAVTFSQDRVRGYYQRPMDQVYQASVAVVQNNGVIVTEFIPHDTTNTVRSLQAKVDRKNVWVSVEAVDPNKPITLVTVQVRSPMGVGDIDLAHELDKEIALKLASE